MRLLPNYTKGFEHNTNDPNTMIFSCTKKVLDKVKKHRPVEVTKVETGFQLNW